MTGSGISLAAGKIGLRHVFSCFNRNKLNGFNTQFAPTIEPIQPGRIFARLTA